MGKASKSPTHRTMKRLRGLGYTAAIVERWNQYANVRQDLYGFIDVLAIKAGEPPLAIQACARSSMQSRVKKIREEERAQTWLAAGCRIQVWGWGRVQRKNRSVYKLRLLELSGPELEVTNEFLEE